MGMSVSVKTKEGKEIDCWKPSHRFEEFKGVFDENKAVNGCTCGGHMCTCYDYDDYLVKETDDVGDELLREYLKEYKELLISYSC